MPCIRAKTGGSAIRPGVVRGDGSYAGAMLGADSLVRASAGRVGLALCYHAVAPRAGDTVNELVAPIGLDEFERQLDQVRRAYRPVPVSELPAAIAARTRRDPIPIAVTFDDDLPCHVELTADALERHDVPATFFLSGAGLAGRREFWWQTLERAWNAGLLDTARLAGLGLGPAASLREAAASVQALPLADRLRVASALQELTPPGPGDRLLDAAEIADLAARFEVGFHTFEHDDLRTLDDGALAEAMTRGRAELEAVAGPVTTIAYPHGGADERVARAARAAGFAAGYRSSGGAARAGDDPFLLPRDYPHRGSAAGSARALRRALRAAGRTR